MAKEILTKRGTPIVWADATDFAATLNGYTRTAQIDLTSLANGKARQGAKVDLGEKRARYYVVRVGIEVDVAPTAGLAIPVYFSFSASATAAVGNSGGCSGADGAYKDSEEAEWVNQLQPVGNLYLTNDAATVVQVGDIGFLMPRERYVMPVIYNTSGQALEGDAVEMFLALIPMIDELQ